jgi:hypothetical protein
MRQIIVDFITSNGWVESDSDYSEKIDYSMEEWRTFYKKDNIGIDISDNKIVLIDDSGDFKQFKIDVDSKYTLLGFLLYYKYIAIDYNSP